MSVAIVNAVVAPDTTVAATTRYMQGRTKDMLASDYGQHDVTSTTASWRPG